MKKILLLLLLSTSFCWADELFYPQNQTMGVARIKSVQHLISSFEQFKTYFKSQPQLMEFWSPISDKWLDLDLEKTLAKFLNVSVPEFESSLSGEAALIVQNNIDGQNFPGVVLSIAPTDPEGVAHLSKIIKSGECFDKITSAGGSLEGVCQLHWAEPDKTQIQESSVSKQIKQIDLYLFEGKSRLWLATDLNFLDDCIAAQDEGFCPDFLRQSDQSDLAIWVDPSPIVAFFQQQAQQTQDEDSASIFGPGFLPALGLDQATGVGVNVDLTQHLASVELSSQPDATGIFSLLDCAPTGVEKSPLIPDGASEFSIGRFDMECLWREFKGLAARVVPASDTIYRGWQAQMQDDYGVAIDNQLFGSMGTHYLSYDIDDEQGGVTQVVFLQLRDCVSFQKALDAVIDFFSQGKVYFDKQKIGSATLYRLKGEFQSSADTSFCFAITPRWVILSAGAPSEINHVIENISSSRFSGIWKNPSMEDLAQDNEYMLSFGYRSMQNFWQELASATLSLDADNAQDTGSASLWSGVEDPDFSKIEGGVTYRVYHQPGLLKAILKFNVSQ